MQSAEILSLRRREVQLCERSVSPPQVKCGRLAGETLTEARAPQPGIRKRTCIGGFPRTTSLEFAPRPRFRCHGEAAVRRISLRLASQKHFADMLSSHVHRGADDDLLAFRKASRWRFVNSRPSSFSTGNWTMWLRLWPTLTPPTPLDDHLGRL